MGKSLIIMSLFVTAIPVMGQANNPQQQIDVGGEDVASTLPEIMSIRRMSYIDVGEVEDQSVWDFSGIKPLSDYRQEIVLNADSTSLMLLDDKCIRQIKVEKDGVMMYGMESPLITISYDSPINILPFGLSYNNSISYPFHCTGMYCQNKLLDINGTYTIEADAEGSICITEGDTIHNVLRLHAIKTASIGMKAPEDSLGIAPGSYRQEIEDRYIWCASDSQLPIFETISTTYYDDLVKVSCMQEAKCWASDGDFMLHDSAEKEQKSQNSDNGKSNGDRDLQYEVTIDGTYLNIHYTLSRRAKILAIVCDAQGHLFRNTSSTADIGTHDMRIDCSGLGCGNYILYLNVNGIVYSEKVHL